MFDKNYFDRIKRRSVDTFKNNDNNNDPFKSFVRLSKR